MHPLRFLQKLLKKVTKVWIGNLLCGNFNSVVICNLDTSSPFWGRSASLCDILNREDLYDTWRCLHANEKTFTNYSPRYNYYSRLDLFLVDRLLLQRIYASSIQDVAWSDHALVTLEIEEGNTVPLHPQACEGVTTQYSRIPSPGGTL